VALFLSNEDVRNLITVPECVSVMEDLFLQESRGLVENLPRRRQRLGKLGTSLMGGSVLGSQVYGVRHSNVSVLYGTESGRLEAVFEPGTLAWIRTGAASGVAAKYMSDPDASVVGLIGAGRQAVTQIEAICAVRPVRQVKVFSRTADTRERFAREMSASLEIEFVPVATPEEAVRGSQIVCAITNAPQPVFDGNLLEPGTHVIAAGSNNFTKREVDLATIQRASLVAVDNLEQAKIECGELMWAADRGEFRWQDAVELHRVVSGAVVGRPAPDAITLFESQGIGIEDVAAMAYVLNKARAQGAGTELPF
jgi:ornithine cyclodeaminase/alanine dehydrogenase-like protein (mu-crystallin family)